MDEVLFTATRPVILNGIPDLTLRPDLGDRTLSVDFRAIPDRQRRAERELQEQFKAMQPSVLGALMELASLALRRTDEVTAKDWPSRASPMLPSTLKLRVRPWAGSLGRPSGSCSTTGPRIDRQHSKKMPLPAL
jgi:hypothetical protein